jgi:large subunit ribosomal protein L4e
MTSINFTLTSITHFQLVFTAPIRSDVIHDVHTLMAKNARQAYAVGLVSGMQTPAVSWGTGRAVARIPRVPGGGTSRSGQGAFGNMCRGGRMFAPNKIWRRWHKKISVGQRRFAVSSALAATAVPALVMARGHRVDQVPEFPLVLADSLNRVSKTKDAIEVLTKCGAMADVEKVKASKKVHTGVGKMRNRRYTQRRGPMVVYDVSEGLDKAFRNLPGVELTLVDNLSLLDLAPGGHLGRFVVWTKGAFEKLDSIFGTYEEGAKFKTGFNLPRSSMTNADLARIINSDEIQSIVKPACAGATLVIPQKRNPLRNSAVKIALNPYHAVVKAREEKLQSASAADKGKAKKAAKVASAKRSKQYAAQRKAFIAASSLEGEIKF